MTRPEPPVANHFHGFRKRTEDVSSWLRGWLWIVAHRRHVWAITRGRFDPALRETVMIAVAQVNACRWCSYAHQTWGREVGLDESDVARLAQGEVALSDARLAAGAAYARERADAGFGPVPAPMHARLRTVFEERDATCVEVVARLMHQANMAGNGLDGLLSRWQGRPPPDSRLLDDLIIGGFGFFAIGVAVPIVSIVWWRSPRRIFRELLDFVQGYEDHAGASGSSPASGAGR